MNRWLVTVLLSSSFLLSAATAVAQNRRLAMDYLSRGTRELDAGNLDAALSLFNRAIELDTNYGAAYFSRGLVRKRQSDLDGAISDFTHSIELKPMAEAYLDRGATKKDKGDRDGAIADYNKALELNPSTPMPSTTAASPETTKEITKGRSVISPAQLKSGRQTPAPSSDAD